MTKPLRRLHNSMIARLVVFILPFIVVVFTVSLGFLFQWSRDMVRQEAIERADLMLNNTSLRVGGFLNEIQTATNNTLWLVNENLIPDSLLNYSNRVVSQNPDVKSCSITMEPDFFPQYGRNFSVYSRRDGDSLVSIVEEPYDYYSKVWYKSAYDADKPVWTDPYDDNNEGSSSLSEWISSYSVPIKDKDDNTIGVISTDISLKRLSMTISEEVPYDHSYFVMLGQEGHYFVHTDTTKLAKKTIFDDLDPLTQADIIALGHEMIAGNNGYMEVVVDGETCLVFYKPLENTSWSIALICWESDIFRSYNNLLYVIAPLLFIGLLLLVYFLHRIVNYFVHPLNRLASQTRHIADGNFNVPMPTTTRVDAIGRLQNNFSAMQQSLARYISQLERVNEETEQRNAELACATQQAEEAAQRQVSFLQDLLHQIRTPLNIIMGFVQILRDDYAVIPREELVTITHAMKHNSNAIGRRVHMLMEASSIDLEQTVERNDSVTCMELLKEVEKLNVERASGGAPLQIESLVDEGLKIRVNRKSVVKVLNELVHNAQKYGLVPGHEKDTPIILRARLGYNKLIFSVEDKGPGVPADYRANIFNPFIKANSFSEGLGLGLFVAQRYAVMMGGNLTLDEGYTSGARFILSIPQ